MIIVVQWAITTKIKSMALYLTEILRYGMEGIT